MRAFGLTAIAAVLAGGRALAQTTTTAPASAAPTSGQSSTLPTPEDDGASPEDDGANAWSLSLSAYAYFVPDDRDYVQPTFTADRDWLHLEARYNYEALDTASLWAGYNFSGGESLAWEVTPMLGGVFGDTSGIAIGYKGSVSWWKLQLYSEGEYVFDTGDSSDSFFYNWSELTLSPVEWLRFGVVTQRTRAYETDRDIQRGLLIGVSWMNLDLAAYVFNPDDDKPVVVVSFGVSF